MGTCRREAPCSLSTRPLAALGLSQTSSVTMPFPSKTRTDMQGGELRSSGPITGGVAEPKVGSCAGTVAACSLLHCFTQAMIAPSGRDTRASTMETSTVIPTLPTWKLAYPETSHSSAPKAWQLRSPCFPKEKRFLSLGVLDSSF